MDSHNQQLHLKQWVPSLRPTRWFIINECLLLYSLIQLAIIIITIKDLGKRPIVQGNYMVWSFSTTLLWCFESGLETWWIIHNILKDRRGICLSESFVWMNIFESSVAIYFVFDTSRLLFEWKVNDEDIESSLLDVGLSSAFYFYAIVRDFYRMMKFNVLNQNDEEGIGLYSEIL